MGNLNPPNIQYSYTLALKETESINFIWKEDSEWTKCDDICNGRFVFNRFTIKTYSKTCVKRPLKNRQNRDLNDKG